MAVATTNGHRTGQLWLKVTHPGFASCARHSIIQEEFFNGPLVMRNRTEVLERDEQSRRSAYGLGTCTINQ